MAADGELEKIVSIEEVLDLVLSFLEVAIHQVLCVAMAAAQKLSCISNSFAQVYTPSIPTG